MAHMPWKVKDYIRCACRAITINTVIVWSPFTSKALFVGSPDELPEFIGNKFLHAYRYDKSKHRLIIRAQSHKA